MQNIFVTLITLLFLSACSEDKPEDKTETPQQITTKENEIVKDENIPNPQETEQKTAISQVSNENIAPNNSTNQVDDVLTQKPKEQKKPEIIALKVSFNVGTDDMVLGNKESNVVIVEYFSPTCPHCAYYHSTIFPELKKKYIDTNKIAYVTREFVAAKQDLDASILARCKGDVNSFIQFHKIMLEQQDKWAYSMKYRELLTDIGQLGGISPEEYKKCLNDDKITEILIANTNFVSKVPKFIGTPAFFVNGVQTVNYSMLGISAAIDKALAAKNEVDL